MTLVVNAADEFLAAVSALECGPGVVIMDGHRCAPHPFHDPPRGSLCSPTAPPLADQSRDWPVARSVGALVDAPRSAGLPDDDQGGGGGFAGCGGLAGTAGGGDGAGDLDVGDGVCAG